MKNKFKKIFALLIAMSVMMITAAVPLTASADGDGSITINAQSGEDLTGRSFDIYKIFSATTSGDNTSYQWYYVNGNNIYYNFFYNSWSDGENDHDPYIEEDTSGNGSVQKVVDALVKIKSDTSLLTAFANDLYTYITTYGSTEYSISATATVSTEDTEGQSSVTVNNLDYGYNLIYDTATISAGSETVRSAIILLTATDSTAETTLKADVPTITKKITEVNDDEKGSGSGVDEACATIGDTIEFTITSTVADTSSFSSYTYIITDTLPEYFDYVTDSLTVSRNGITIDNTDNAAYSTNIETDSDDVTTITITFTSDYMLNTCADGDYITVVFDAVLNNNAVQLNENTVELKYSNDSTDLTSYGTAEDNAIVVTFDMQFQKVNTAGTALTGAEFELYRSTAISGTVTSATEAASAATWEKIWFEKRVYSSYDSGDAETVYRAYYDSTGVYATLDPSGTYEDSDEHGSYTYTYTTVLEVDSSGYVYIEGLGATIDSSQYIEGFYNLVEITAPDGYALPTADYWFQLYAANNQSTGEVIYNMSILNYYQGSTVTPTAGIIVIGGGGSVTPDSQLYDYADNAYYYFKVLNVTSEELPETGGMGTTLFIIGGIVLMACAAGALLFLNKGKKA